MAILFPSKFRTVSKCRTYCRVFNSLILSSEILITPNSCRTAFHGISRFASVTTVRKEWTKETVTVFPLLSVWPHWSSGDAVHLKTDMFEQSKVQVLGKHDDSGKFLWRIAPVRDHARKEISEYKQTYL